MKIAAVEQFSAPRAKRARSFGRALAVSMLLASLGCGSATGDTPNASSAESPAAEERSDTEARLVEVYVTDWCPYCQRLEAFLKENQVAYVRKNVEADDSARREHRALGGGGIPVTRIDGDQVVRGFRPEVIADLLGIEAN